MLVITKDKAEKLNTTKNAPVKASKVKASKPKKTK